MDLNPTIASLEPPAGQGERAWRKHLSHPAGIRTVLPRLGPELLRQQLQGIAFRPFQALGLGCQRRSDPFLPPHLEGGEGSAGNLGMLTQVWTRSAEPGQDPVCERLDPWRREQGVLSRQQLLVGTLERKGKFACAGKKREIPLETFPGVYRQCLWMGEPAFLGIPLLRDFTSQPFHIKSFKVRESPQPCILLEAFIHSCHSRASRPGPTCAPGGT